MNMYPPVFVDSLNSWIISSAYCYNCYHYYHYYQAYSLYVKPKKKSKTPYCIDWHVDVLKNKVKEGVYFAIAPRPSLSLLNPGQTLIIAQRPRVIFLRRNLTPGIIFLPRYLTPVVNFLLSNLTPPP
jgi:hypothetical protein